MKRCSYCNGAFWDDKKLAEHIEWHEHTKIDTHTDKLSDNTCNHTMKEQKSTTCDDCGKVMLKASMRRHRQVCKKNEKNIHSELNAGCVLSDLRTEVMRDSKLYDEKILRGEMIWKMICAGEIKEESLSKKNRHCLDLYMDSSEE